MTKTAKLNKLFLLTSRWPLILLCLGTLTLGIVLYDRVIRYRVFPKRFGVVEPGLIFRSGQISEHLIKPTLEEHGIKVVVDLTWEQNDAPEDQEERDKIAETNSIKELGIESFRFPMPGDGRGSVDAYTEALVRMVKAVQAKAPVLVHCSAGSQRTGGVVACYSLLFEKKPMDEVLDEMKEFAWNPVKDKALTAHLNAIMPELVARLVERGVLAEAPKPLPVFPVGS